MLRKMQRRNQRWRQVGVWLPAAFIATTAAVAVLGLGRVISDVAVVAVIAGLGAAGAVAFSRWIFQALGQAQQETDERARELAAINEASLALSSDLDLSSLLQRVVDLSRVVTGAKYGALAMLGEDGDIAQFVTSGLSQAERDRIGALPEGRGLLGAVIKSGETLRVDNIASHPQASGFPPNHPHMTTFLGMPVRYEGRIVGDLYLTNKDDGSPFSERDEEILRAFAAHAATAIENALLYRQVQDLAVLEERDRIGMDMHDGVIQSLYATGLKIENCLEDLKDDPSQVEPQLHSVLDQLNKSIADLRGYIFNLRPAELVDADLAGAIGSLLQELKVNALLDVQLIEGTQACEGLSEQQTEALFNVARESLANVRKHADAHSVTARLELRNGGFRMMIIDDGKGFDPGQPNAGLGLRNIRERVSTVGGQIDIKTAPGQGTEVTVDLPLGGEK
ncbi:MAG: GAF domain-containing sensor histidine kinase [Chloroflexi bacterium]|nr:GAF domain-containing sensor histidine kinase [Chloroflexota bacterium]